MITKRIDYVNVFLYIFYTIFPGKVRRSPQSPENPLFQLDKMEFRARSKAPGSATRIPPTLASISW